MRHTEDILVFSQKPVVYFPQMVKGRPQHAEGTRIGKVGNTYGRQGTDYAEKVGNDLKYPGSLIVLPKDHASKCVHPTQKPVALMEYLIRTYTQKGETVLDFTMGSGTTGVACVNTGREFIGIERDPEYFAISEDRIGWAQIEAMI